MYVDERVVEKSAFYNHVVKLRIHQKICSKFMSIGKAAGLDVITIARKGLWVLFIPPRFLDCMGSEDLCCHGVK
jgi:hypothetical protein